MGDARPKTKRHDMRFMDRAISLAMNAAGNVAPNPMVGCVIVQADEQIVGEGWHIGAGQPHAEIEALSAAGKKARGATVYITLEPCNHQGRTGPCTEALIEAGVKEVIYAMGDPNPLATGGADRLRAAGIAVVSGVLEKPARRLNRAWLHSLEFKRPYVIAKSAMSLDGRIATHKGESKWITGAESRRTGHELRTHSDAIIVGAGTVIMDDPALTARLDNVVRMPLRIIMDSTARTSPGAKAYERSGKGALLITTDRAATQQLQSFQKMGVETLVLQKDQTGRPDLSELLAQLHEREIVTLLIEGGGELIGAFFDAGLIDEINLFIAPKLIGGGKPAFGGDGVEHLTDAGRFEFDDIKHNGPDIWMRGFRRREAS